MTLLKKGLLLRGGIVEGPLTFDLRITTSNFQKNLPNSDVLARCVAMEKKVKGARLVLSTEIAEPFFEVCLDWLTLQGYASDPHRGNADLLLQRSLVPLPDGSAYDLLFPVLALSEDAIIDKRIKEMNYLIKHLPRDISKHHLDTKALLRHSKVRIKDHNAQQKEAFNVQQ